MRTIISHIIKKTPSSIKFDFSAAYVKELAEFVKSEMDKL